MAGQGRSPCGLGGSKGGHSSGKNGPLSSCRTSCGNLFLNGVDVKTVSSMLGHYSAGFTLDTYAHVTTDAQLKAAQTMGNILSRAV